MGKEKKKPVWRKSYINIITEEKSQEDELISCEYCGSLMQPTLTKCPHCGASRKRKSKG